MKKSLVALLVCGILPFTGCIDNGFNLADTSGEVTVGGEELVVPLAKIEPITLGDLLKENEMIKSDENGVYKIQYSSFGDDPEKYEFLSIGGIEIPAITGLSPKLDPISFSFQELPTTLSMSGINQTFEVDYPSINRFVTVDPIKMSEAIALQLPISGQGAISESMLSLLKMQGLDVIKNEYNDEIVFNADIELLEQLNKIDWVEFGCDKHPYGAPFEVKVDLQGLQDVVGGGSVKLNVEFPSGYYLRDEQGKDFPEATHNIVSREVVLQPKQKQVAFVVYLNRIDYSNHTAVNGKLEIDDHIKYGYELALNLGAGTYNLNNLPTFSIETAPEYKDVEVVINHFEMDKVTYDLNYTFDGMPNGIDINKVAFKDTYLTLSFKGLEWLKIIDNKTNQDIPVNAKITLPECMHFAQSTLLNGNALSASAVELAKGVRLKLDYIDCTAKEVKQENGQLVIASKIVAEIDLKSIDGKTVLVSSLTPPQNPLVVNVAIAETQLKLDTANTIVEWGEDQTFDLDLGDNIPSISQSVDVPEMISSVECITIGKAGGNGAPVGIDFSLASGGSFPVNELDVDVAINLGKLLRPTKATLDSGIITKNANGDYILAIKESWQPRKNKLAKRVEFEALENIPAVTNGKITLNQSFPVTGSVKIKSGENIDLSEIGEAKIDIDVKIDDIEARTFTGGVDIAVAPDQMVVELGDIGDLGVDINSLSINPILNVKLKDNPTGVPFSANIAVKTFNAEGEELQNLVVPTITVAGSGASNIVLSTPYHAPKYVGNEEVTFIEVEGLANLLSNGIPSKIAVDMSVATNSNEIYTIDLARAAQGYTIEYQYEVVVPLELDGNVDIAYGTTISGLNELFTDLADTTKGIKVGDVGLIAEIGTTIPFNIVISAELVNENGTTEGVEARLNINNCVVKGSAVAGERSVSNIDLDFDLGDSHSLEGLKKADGVRLKFTLYNTDIEVAKLMKDQYLDGKLKLRVRNGLTVDIFDFLNSEVEE